MAICPTEGQEEQNSHGVQSGVNQEPVEPNTPPCLGLKVGTADLLLLLFKITLFACSFAEDSELDNIE